MSTIASKTHSAMNGCDGMRDGTCYMRGVTQVDLALRMSTKERMCDGSIFGPFKTMHTNENF